MSDPAAEHHDDAHHGDGHAHPPHLAHHFETPEQQMESGKLGMWVFLATEILMFGGLFCAYAVYRGNHPEVFLFAHQALDTNWGAINTAVLLASSFTMAWGVRAAQLGQSRLLVALLSLTLLGGGGFMVIKTIEYESKYEKSLWVGGLNAFYQSGGQLADADKAKKAADYVSHHGYDKGEGHGGDQHGSGKHHDEDHHEEGGLIGLAEDGQPLGGDEHVSGDEDVDMTDSPTPDGTFVPSAAGSPDAGPANPNEQQDYEPVPPAAPVVEGSQIARPAEPEVGLVSDVVVNGNPEIALAQSMFTGVGEIQAQHRGSHYPEFDELAPDDTQATHIFFQIYFMMTGLHGVHVLIGMGLIGWITWGAGGPITKAVLGPAASVAVGGYLFFVGSLVAFPVWLIVSIAVCGVAAIASGVLNYRRLRSFAAPAFSSEYYTPVDLVGLYWHLVDLIWIFLFPLLYLIH
ncbi:MAG: hypothetical protein AAF800_01025 [Planctomycetota bacterium]